MRRTTATRVILMVAIALLHVLALYGLSRWYGDRDEHKHGAGHEKVDHPPGPLGRTPAGPASGVVVNGVRVIKVTARKFEFDPARIIVRQGEKVRLEVTSEDVVHGIGIEAYGIDRKLDPGKTEAISFTADKPGEHHFHCSVYCGSGHGDMHGELLVIEHEQ